MTLDFLTNHIQPLKTMSEKYASTLLVIRDMSSTFSKAMRRPEQLFCQRQAPR